MKPRFQRAILRAVPTGLVLGACIELFMIKVQIGHETFYDTVTRKEAERRAQGLRSADGSGGSNATAT